MQILLQYFTSAKVLIEHRGTCLKINDKQTVKLKSGSIKFLNHFKKLAMPFKNYADFECNVKRIRVSDRNDKTRYTEKYQAHIPYKIVCVDVLYREKNKVNRFIEVIFGEHDYR